MLMAGVVRCDICGFPLYERAGPWMMCAPPMDDVVRIGECVADEGRGGGCEAC